MDALPKEVGISNVRELEQPENTLWHKSISST
jgi:hypothetical protein